ncbi:hypothetical protein ACIBCN_28670 [Nocardia sp. NPDC051052]|uniref:hypothetical protein n=1 Tax=Nocardia sp. NPDC051052 TaxID=3364322 RepID=UPI0037A17996
MTLIGVHTNNRTNRAAIRAADDRELRKWQREMVIRSCVDAVETALRLQGKCMNLAYPQLPLAEAEELHGLLGVDAHTIGANAATLRMLNARMVATACAELYSAATDPDFFKTFEKLPSRWTDEDERAFSVGYARIEKARDGLVRHASTELFALEGVDSEEVKQEQRRLRDVVRRYTGTV